MVAIVSDLHYGSLYQQPTALNSFVVDCLNANIDTLVCCGDIVDGLMYRKLHKSERFLHNVEDYIEYVACHYPYGFKHNIFITGNHCRTLDSKCVKVYGHDFGTELTVRRPDLTYLPGVNGTNATYQLEHLRIHMYHGGKGHNQHTCSQNRTDRTQKICDDLLELDMRTDILLCGHCHSTSFLPSYRGVAVAGLGCFQSATARMELVGSLPDTCSQVLYYEIKDDRACHLNVEFRYFTPAPLDVEQEYLE